MSIRHQALPCPLCPVILLLTGVRHFFYLASRAAGLPALLAGY
jgi:tRNA(Arg) A34 adenosine deaminase TadA